MEREWLVPFAFLATCEWLFAQGLAWFIGYPTTPDYYFHFSVAAIFGGTLLFGYFAYHLLRLMRRMTPHPSRELAAVWKQNSGRILSAAVGLVFTTLHSISFNWSKSMMPFVVPFWADKPLADFDEALFGKAAWQWAYDLTGPASEIFRLAYVAWYPFALFLPIAVICMPRSRQKSALLISFLLIWLMGGLIALIFSSAGPLFYGPLGLGDRFADLPQQSHLDTIPKVAGYLWANYENLNATPGGGISAFPSLHVAMGCWIGLVFRHWLAWIFAGLIFFGSFLLGWHYFLDAPGGVGVALLAYWLARSYVDRTQSPILEPVLDVRGGARA